MNKWLTQIEPMIAAATQGMTEEQLVWHPEGKWSAAQILDHLRKTYTRTVLGYDKVQAEGKPLATSTSLAQQIGKFVLLTLGYFPSGRKSPEMVKPEPDCSGKDCLQSIRRELARLVDAQLGAEAKFAHRDVMDHPVLGPLTPEQWARFHYVHARHHMKQIDAIRQQMATARTASA